VILLTVSLSSVHTYFIVSTYYDDEVYKVYLNGTVGDEYSTTEPDGYPTLGESGPM